MPRHVVVIAVVFLLCGYATATRADEAWYLNRGDACTADSPAQFMIVQRNMGVPYTAADITDSGKIVETTISSSLFGVPVQWRFYRGLSRCQAAIDAVMARKALDDRAIADKYGEPTKAAPVVAVSAPDRQTKLLGQPVLIQDPAVVPMSADQRKAVSDEVRRCWTNDPGASGPNQMQVMLRVETNDHGTARAADIYGDDIAKLVDPEFRTFAERARRVALDPRCASLPLPSALMGKPTVVVFRFNP